ncbi:hypothetical protein GCK32_017496 [Trichostrongylus colubriformis]|uniref:Uncharacterized protein n=1 Tax=Trichostrongylus colubriformis TaxID=6319 RepID=A0AAN8FVN1_TRICO
MFERIECEAGETSLVPTINVIEHNVCNVAH